MPAPHPPGLVHRSARGHTLIELLLVGMLLAWLLTSAVPSFQAFLSRRHLDGIAAQWVADLQFLRTGAVARHEPLRLTYLHTAQGSGWAVHTGEADTCSVAAAAAAPITCSSGSELLRSAWWPVNARVAVQANVTSMRVDPRQGTVTPTGSWELSSSDGVRLRHVVNILGRVRVCTPGPNVSGVPAC